MFKLMDAKELITRTAVGEVVQIAFEQRKRRGDSQPVLLRRAG